MATDGEYGGLFDGFEAYQTVTDDDYRALLTGGLVVPDTNVFLNLYRYNERTRNDLLGVLAGLGGRLWIPRQVMIEFWQKRETTLVDPRDTDKTAKAMAAHREQAIKTFRTWVNRVGLPPDRASELENILAESFKDVIDGIEDLADNDVSQFASNTNKDPVLVGLKPILDGRVGSGLDDSDYQKALKEAQRRTDERRPPGFKDNGRPGDYLIWAETLREAQRRNLDVLIVTGDVKEDWWRIEHGQQRGPRPELAEELRSLANARLFMLRPESLLRHAKEILQFDVQDESVQDIERLSEAEDGGWTIETIEQLLARLNQEGWTAQEKAIRIAGLSNGFIERDVVYEIGQYSEDRSLRGFTRPINRIVREFKAQGIVPESAIEILLTEYDSSNLPVGWTSGFSVPETIVPMIKALQRDWRSQGLSDPDPEKLDAAIAEFSDLGHLVDEGESDSDTYGMKVWRCRRCGSELSLVNGGERWISPSGRARCIRANNAS